MEAARQDVVVGAGSGKLSPDAAQFFRRVYAPARAGCLHQLRGAGCSEEEAEEIFQATLERVMETVDPVSRRFAVPQMVNLLKTACHRRLIDERRHQGVLRQAPLVEAGAVPDEESDTPAEVAESHEMVAMGREAVASLSERDRQVFVQRHQLGLEPDEILENFPGLSRRTYRKIMQRANARVLAAFEEIDRGDRCRDMKHHFLRRFVADEIPAEEVTAIEAHLSHCRACRLTVVEMRGYLHDVASALGVISAASVPDHGNILVAAASRLADAGQAIADSSRALREKLREQAIRTATSMPGSGGDAATGQVLGMSSAKVVAGACGVVGSGIAVGATCAVLGVSPLAAVGWQQGEKDPDVVEQTAEPTSPAGPEYLPAPVYEPAPSPAAEPKVEDEPQAADEAGSESGREEPLSPTSPPGARQTDEELGLGSTGRPPRSSPAPSAEESSAAPSVSSADPAASSEEAEPAPETGSGGGGEAPVRGGGNIGL